MIFDLNNKEIKKYITQAEFGLEREGLRVCRDGSLAHTKHPFPQTEYIDRDFCENQIEIISDVFSDTEKLIESLNKVQDYIYAVLSKQGELLWAFSNPPKINGEYDIVAAKFNGELAYKSEYRNYLAQKYGKKKMLFSGIHLNLSFSEKLLETAFEQSRNNDYQLFKNHLYLELSKRLVEYGWLIVFLTASSPVTDSSFGIESNKYSSVRCSKEGYWNDFVPILDYSGFESYIESIEMFITDGKLKSVSELYYPVRLKPRGSNSLESLKQNGVNHLEIRTLDVNPLSRTGIFKEDIDFIHLLCIYLATLPEFNFDEEHQRIAVDKIKSAAVFGNNEIKRLAKGELDKIESFSDKNFPEYSYVVSYQKSKLNKNSSYAERVSAEYGENYLEKGIKLSKQYAGEV